MARRQDPSQRCLLLLKQNKIDLTFVGPEGYLSDGIVNLFQEDGQRILGPRREAAILEKSKCYTKDLLKSLQVPLPPYRNFDDSIEAKEYAIQCFSETPAKGPCG